jgi:hypothetical protein
MIPNIDLKTLIPVEEISGEDAEETALLKQMLRNATEYLRRFRWCPPIDRAYFGCGVGGVAAVFLYHFREPIQGTDEWLWVVEGDVPTAYLVLDQAGDPATALEVYCRLMDDWAKGILEERPLKDIFPVGAEPSPENARNLVNRLDFIRTRLLPRCRAKWASKE